MRSMAIRGFIEHDRSSWVAQSLRNVQDARTP
jgi:hypothetical protein